MIGWALKKVMGSRHERELKRLQPRVDAINALEKKVAKLSDDQLRARTAEFREKLDRGASLDDLLVPAFATVREAGKRVLGMRHYDVQLIGGMVLHEGKIAEMRTGEGKTLVATLPCYLNALEGKGVHVVTVNDYLARRDAEWMGQLHSFLGMSVDVIVPQSGNAAKKRAYLADITYGQNNEFGFDYLRDNMKFSIFDYAQRPLNYAIVDEVDSILIDEARTPLIISGPGQVASDKYQRITELIPKLRRDEHYEVDEKGRSVALTEAGMEYSEQLLGRAGMLEKSESKSSPYRGEATGNLYDLANVESLHILQQCLRAHALYQRDTHYMVVDGEVVIIDEFTGRTLKGRRWSEGLHQAVEAKERVPIKEENITLATISFQNLFRLYSKLSGMTGTAETEAGEFHSIYELDVNVIPTNKPIARIDSEDVVYKSEPEKFRAIAEEIGQAVEAGRPVLVGTTSVEKSEVVSRLLSKKGVAHSVLNAKQHEREAYVVAQAGVPGSVTVATNMAGRGTDILLGGNPEMLARLAVLQQPEAPEMEPEAIDEAAKALEPEFEARCKADREKVKQAGGLHIIGTERHESRRIDNQLRGRAGRQGDPGSSRFFLSLEDDLMRIFAGDKVSGMMDRLGMEEDVPIEHKWVTKSVENAQKKVEERNFDIRKHLLDYDDVMNQQRKSIYALRRQVLTGTYRTIPSEADAAKGAVPEPMVEEADASLGERAKPILEQMVKIHGAKRPPQALSDEELATFREKALAANIGAVQDLDEVAIASIERDVYRWFGCVVDLSAHRSGREALAFLVDDVALRLTEQRERLLDNCDELVGGMVEKHCAPNKHFEDWSIDDLEDDFEEQFDIDCPDLTRFADAQEIAVKLYADVEGVLTNKMKEFGSESFLRLYRNAFLQEIDQKWIDHLQAMNGLRAGIGLRGYGQRDPKKEYKREGFDMFVAMTESIKADTVRALFTVRRVREEDLQALEAQRKKAAEERQRSMQTRHDEASEERAPGRAPRRAPARPGARPTAQRPGPGGPTQGPGPGAAPAPQLNRAQRRAAAKKAKKKGGRGARP